MVKYRMRDGKDGFDVLYKHNNWLGFIYAKEYKNIVFIEFFAISESVCLSGYGSIVMDSMKNKY
ncbi:MAG: hypothetical protein ACI9VT_003779 [Psychroserpens sp.]|jgi:hypothetical protein